MSSPVQIRRACFDHWKRIDANGKVWLDCWLCNLPIDPVRQMWDAEHSLRRTVGGSDDPENVRPAHRACHRPKTASDNTANEKGKRVSDRHFGIKRPKGFYRPKGAKFDWATGRYRRDAE